jgi:hypothetical protein
MEGGVVEPGDRHPDGGQRRSVQAGPPERLHRNDGTRREGPTDRRRQAARPASLPGRRRGGRPPSPRRHLPPPARRRRTPQYPMNRHGCPGRCVSTQRCWSCRASSPFTAAAAGTIGDHPQHEISQIARPRQKKASVRSPTRRAAANRPRHYRRRWPGGAGWPAPALPDGGGPLGVVGGLGEDRGWSGDRRARAVLNPKPAAAAANSPRSRRAVASGARWCYRRRRHRQGIARAASPALVTEAPNVTSSGSPPPAA